MKTKLVRALIVFAVLSCGAGYVKGQTPADPDLNRLKDEIQRRELVDHDATILRTDKEVNRINLSKAREKLRTLLQSQIEAKRKLRILLGPSITPQESQSIEAALQSLEADLQQLERSVSASSSSSPANEETTSAAAPQRAPAGTDSAGTTDPGDQPVASNAPDGTASNASSGGTTFAPPPTAALRSGGPAASPGAASANTSDVLPIRKCSEVKQNIPSASNLEKFFCARIQAIQRDKHAPQPIPGLDLHRDFFFFMITLLAREGRAQYVVAAENERVDKQVGSDASSSGSTSLVSKGSVPTILGFAVDTGALLKSTNGSTITFRGNVAGLAKALAGKGFITGYDEDSPAARFLRRTSFSFSFDPTRGNQSGVFTGNKQQISNYSVRMDLYNKRDAREPRYKKDWNTFLANQSQDLVAQIDSSLRVLTDVSTNSTNTWTDRALQDWYVLADSAVRGVDGVDQIDAVMREQLNKVPKNLSPTTLAELRSFDKRFKAWLDERESILDKIAKAPIVTVEYVNDRPLNATSLSKFNFIGEGGFGPRLDLTFNGSVTIFDKKPATAGRVRDYQFAAQFDAPFGEIGLGLGKPVLSFAGKYERLVSNATTAAGTTAPGTKGTIGVGQIKLTIPVKNSGIRIPISFSFANRTELIKEKEVRGNFGFTFDVDTLFALFKPFSQK